MGLWPAPAPAPAPDPAPAPAQASFQFPRSLRETNLHPISGGINQANVHSLKQIYWPSHLTPENGIRQQSEDYKQTHQNLPAPFNRKADAEAGKQSHNEAKAAISEAVSEAVSVAVVAIMEQKEMSAKLTELTRVAGETIARAAASLIEAGNKSKRPVSGQGPEGGF